MKSARSSVLDRLQGIWYVAELEIEGNPVPPGEAQIVVKGDRFTSVGMGAVYQGKIIVDESQEPAAIDMKFTKGTEKGNTNRGIFEFQGDSWRLCLQTTGKDRPATFATAHGTGLALESLQRIKPASKAKTMVDSAPAGIPVPELEGEWAMQAHSTGGKPLDPAHVAMGRRVAKGGEVTVFMGPQVITRARYSVDPSRMPNTMDYDLGNGKTQLGIFDLRGDTLQVSFAAPGQPRPSSLTAGYTVTTWKRIRS